MKFTRKDIEKSRLLRRNSTPQEIILWSKLRSRRFASLKFRRQVAIARYVVDFICWEKKLIIEVDGWQHKTRNNKEYDKERTRILEKLGFKVIRFWNNDINKNLEGVLLKIEECL